MNRILSIVTFISAISVSNIGYSDGLTEKQFWTMFKKSVSEGLTLSNCSLTPGETDTSKLASSNVISLRIEEKRKNGKSIFVVDVGNPTSDDLENGNYLLEKVDEWDWSTTDNIGKDRFRFLSLSQPSLSKARKIYEIYVDVKEETKEILSLKYSDYLFKNEVKDLNQSFLDIVSSSEKVYCSSN